MFLLINNKKMLALSVLLVIWAALPLFLIFSWSVSVEAETEILGTQDAQKLQLVVGKSIILKVTKPVKRISVADPEIADFVLISPYEIYIKGKAPGITNMTLWKNKSINAIYDMEVSYDITRLKEKLHDILPEEGDIRVLATQDSITLSGKVTSGLVPTRCRKASRRRWPAIT